MFPWLVSLGICIVCAQLLVAELEGIGSTGKEGLGMAMAVQTAGLVVGTTLELGGRGGTDGTLEAELEVCVSRMMDGNGGRNNMVWTTRTSG